MAITRSTPQAIISNTSDNGPYSIAVTVPAGGLCAVLTTMAHCWDGALEQARTVSLSDSGSHAWTQRAITYNRNGGAIYASAVFIHEWYNGTGSGVTMTVNIDTSGFRFNPFVRIAAQILTDVKDPASYTPVVVTTYTHVDPSVKIRPTAVGSQILGAISSRIDTGSGDLTGAFTALLGSTIGANMQANNSAHAGAVVARTTTEVSRGDDIVFGASAVAQPNGVISLAAVEYLPTGATGGAGSLPQRGAAGQRVAIIGDSLMNQGGSGQVDVSAAFVAAGWPGGGIWFRGIDGKQIAAAEAGSGLTTMQNIVQCRSDLGVEPDLWYIQLLGNDFGSTDQQIRDDIQLVLDTLGASANVAWVTMVQSASVSGNLLRGNAILHDMIANRPNSYVVDWWEYAVENNNPDSWYTDGTHMTPGGYAAKNNYMATESIEAMYQLMSSGMTHYRVRSDGTWMTAHSKARIAGSWVAGTHYGIRHDATPPAQPTITSPATSGTLTPTITGTAEANSTIDLTINATNYQAVANVAGDWSIAVTPALVDGQSYPLSVTATDIANNTSVASTQNLQISLAGMTPADLSGLALWLKADTMTGLANGANVTAWQDTTNSLTASPPSTSPTFATNSTPIGLPSVRFSASRSPLHVPGSATPTDTLTYMMVAKAETLVAEAVLVSAYTSGCFGAAMRNTAMASIQPGAAWFGDAPAGTVDTNWHVYAWTYDNPADTITYAVDGVASSVSTSNGPMASDIYFIGSAGAGFGGFDGLIAEVAAYDRVLSPTEISDLTAGLGSKYGL